MYQLIFDFAYAYLFNNGDLNHIKSTIGGPEMSMRVWLCHSLSIVTMVLLFAVACMFVKWLFKYVAGMFTGIGR